MNFYDTYPEHDDILNYSRVILSIIDMLLSMGKENVWNSSLPVGSESTRVVELIKVFSLSIYDYQLLNYLYNREEVLHKLSLSLKHKSKTKQTNDNNNNAASPNTTIEYLSKLPPYHSISIKLPHICKCPGLGLCPLNLHSQAHELFCALFSVFQQQLLFTEHQMPLNFKFPERPLSTKDDLMQQPGPKKDKAKKTKSNKKVPANNNNNNNAQVKTTTTPSNKFINEHMIVEQYEIEATTTVESVLDRPSLSIVPGSSVSADKLPSIYLGHVLFTDHKLLLPLFNGSNSKSIGASLNLMNMLGLPELTWLLDLF